MWKQTATARQRLQKAGIVGTLGLTFLTLAVLIWRTDRPLSPALSTQSSKVVASEPQHGDEANPAHRSTRSELSDDMTDRDPIGRHGEALGGRVIDGSTLSPLHAMLTVGSSTIVTDSGSGRFEVPGFGRGVVLRVDCPGYEPVERYELSGVDETIALVPRRSAHVTVVWESGVPASNACIAIVGGELDPGRCIARTTTEGTCDIRLAHTATIWAHDAQTMATGFASITPGSQTKLILRPGLVLSPKFDVEDLQAHLKLIHRGVRRFTLATSLSRELQLPPLPASEYKAIVVDQRCDRLIEMTSIRLEAFRASRLEIDPSVVGHVDLQCHAPAKAPGIQLVDQETRTPLTGQEVALIVKSERSSKTWTFFESTDLEGRGSVARSIRSERRIACDSPMPRLFGAPTRRDFV
jgi:hypothetical protein